MENVTSTVILCGGPINYSHLPIGTNQSNAMIPVNGKPVIGWILDDLIEKQIVSDITVVIRKQDYRLRNFLERVYTDRIGLSICVLTETGSILHSLEAGLKNTQYPAVRIILGDTLIRDEFDAEGDYVYVGQVADSRRWCLVEVDADEQITGYLDKQDSAPPPLVALAGYFHIQDKLLLQEAIRQSIKSGESELSPAFSLYGDQHPIQVRHVQEWFDFGNIDNLVDARRRLLQTRHFNSLVIDPILTTITKISEKSEKLHDELNWYLSLPEKLKVLTPRIIHEETEDNRVRIVQEYYGYPTLAELFVYGDLHYETWVSIIKYILRIHSIFLQYQSTVNADDYYQIYVTKTKERLDEIRLRSPFWAQMLKFDTININGNTVQNISYLMPAIKQFVEQLIARGKSAIIHGDLCFSNILFDLNNQIIRLIDPRGSFGRKGIYGDPRYDIAKLRHSVCGLYDFILADMFTYTQIAPNVFNFQIFSNEETPIISSHFDNMIQEAGYDIKQIRFIEGLMFVSMIPLHADKPQRQIVMYLQGLKLLNEVPEYKSLAEDK